MDILHTKIQMFVISFITALVEMPTCTRVLKDWYFLQKQEFALGRIKRVARDVLQKVKYLT